MVEQAAVNRKVLGSSPSSGATLCIRKLTFGWPSTLVTDHQYTNRYTNAYTSAPTKGVDQR